MSLKNFGGGFSSNLGKNKNTAGFGSGAKRTGKSDDPVRKRGTIINRRRRRKMNRKPLEIQLDELLKKY
tara:strand:- start:333 stop:539 length:207 start_codon:yes stop_codon:yes gene_type:complete